MNLDCCKCTYEADGCQKGREINLPALGLNLRNPFRPPEYKMIVARRKTGVEERVTTLLE